MRTDNLTASQLGQLVVKGNLHNADCKALPDLEFRMESISVERQGGDYQVTVNRCLELAMHGKGMYFNPQNNTRKARTLKRVLRGSQLNQPALASLVLPLMADCPKAEINTYCLVQQSKFDFGQAIPMLPLYQEVVSFARGGAPKKDRLQGKQMLAGLPLSD